MSSTRDWMCRTNSCSTASRSSRIGSKICARSAETADFCAVSLKGCRKARSGRLRIVGFARGVNALSRLKRNRLDQGTASRRRFVQRAPRSAAVNAAHGGERLDHRATNAGSFRLPRMRHRRQSTARRFRPAADRRARAWRPRAAPPRLRKRHDSGKRDVKAEVERRARHRASPVKQ